MPAINRWTVRPGITLDRRPAEAPVTTWRDVPRPAVLAPKVGDQGQTAPEPPSSPPSDAFLSLTSISSADLAGLANMSRAKMMTSLSRVEARVDGLLRREIDPIAAAELHLGLKVLGEHLRRLALVQGGADAVIGP